MTEEGEAVSSYKKSNRLVRVKMQQDAQQPLVSVIVITYNSTLYVVETLESIKQQTYGNIELIISDDHSTDATVTICRAWVNENNNRFVNTTIIVAPKNGGISQNCNQGVNVSTGEWIKIIAGDDALEPGTISSYINHTKANPQIAVVFSNMQAYDGVFEPHKKIQTASNRNEKFNHPNSTSKEQFEILLRTNCVNSPTVMLKKAVINGVGGFDENFPFLEDWPMWLAITKAGIKMHYLDTISVKYRVHSQSVQGLLVKSRYRSRVEMEVDKMFLQKYVKDLSFFEGKAKSITIYRNLLLMRCFANRNNKFISAVSKTIGIIPSMVLRRYKSKFL